MRKDIQQKKRFSTTAFYNIIYSLDCIHKSEKMFISSDIIVKCDLGEVTMDNKQLITFKTAAETLNFTKTASILNFAQSSVTAQIRSLERELETPLFERLGKRLLFEPTKKNLSYLCSLLVAQHQKRWFLVLVTIFF